MYDMETKLFTQDENVEADALCRSRAVNLLNINDIKQAQKRTSRWKLSHTKNEVKIKVRQGLSKFYLTQSLRTQAMQKVMKIPVTLKYRKRSAYFTELLLAGDTFGRFQLYQTL